MKYRPCPCGGEVQLEYYTPPRRPVEWFMRCRECKAMGMAGANEQQAIDRWQEAK